MTFHINKYIPWCVKQCPKSCYWTSYDVKVEETEVEFRDPGMVELEIHLETEHWETSPKYDLLHVVSSLGGVLGLCTGFSLLMLVELAELVADLTGLAVSRAASRLRSRLRSRQRSGVWSRVRAWFRSCVKLFLKPFIALRLKSRLKLRVRSRVTPSR